MRKSVWLRDPVLRKRNDRNVLQYCKSTFVTGSLNASWHNALLEVLFDYNEGWYLSCSFPRPPKRMVAEPEARQLMGEIGKFALTRMKIRIPGLTAKIKLVMKEIGCDWEEGDAKV